MAQAKRSAADVAESYVTHSRMGDIECTHSKLKDGFTAVNLFSPNNEKNVPMTGTIQ